MVVSIFDKLYLGPIIWWEGGGIFDLELGGYLLGHAHSLGIGHGALEHTQPDTLRAPLTQRTTVLVCGVSHTGTHLTCQSG